MADVKDILALSRSPTGDSAPRAGGDAPESGGKRQGRRKKPQGVHREVFALADWDVPVVPTVAQQFKRKRKTAAPKAKSWVWTGFANGARTDGLELRHWQRKDDADPFPFARFSGAVEVLTFSDDEYTKLLKAPGWDLESTRMLMALCAKFDLRWVVVHDRLPGERTLEDIKARFYDVSKRLLVARSLEENAPRELAKHPLASFSYDRKYHDERRRELQAVWERTRAEEDEDREVLAHAKRIQAMRKKRQRARARNNKAGAAAARDHASDINALVDSATHARIRHFTGVRKSGAYLRSSLMRAALPIHPRKMEHVNVVLAELGFARPPMPTARVCAQYNTMRKDTVALINAKRAAVRAEHELVAKRARRAVLVDKLRKCGIVVGDDGSVANGKGAAAEADGAPTGDEAASTSASASDAAMDEASDGGEAKASSSGSKGKSKGRGRGSAKGKGKGKGKGKSKGSKRKRT